MGIQVSVPVVGIDAAAGEVETKRGHTPIQHWDAPCEKHSHIQRGESSHSSTVNVAKWEIEISHIVRDRKSALVALMHNSEISDGVAGIRKEAPIVSRTIEGATQKR